MSTIILIAVAYILGSVPNALWIGKVFKGIDIREHGSKNTGSTNAARVLGAKLGILTLILDISKGAIPVALSLFMKADLLFMKFKGGKAVATTVGVFTVLVPKALLLAAVVFFVIFALTRYVSVSSIIAAISLPIFIFFLYGDIPYTVFGGIITILIIVKHKSNIQRLLNGTESRFTINKK